MNETEKFWVKLLGHEFVGCVRIMESYKVIKGSYEALARQLLNRENTSHIIHLLHITESCAATFESSRPIRIELKYLQALRDPTWQSIFAVFAFIINHYPKAMLKSIPWDEIVQQLDNRAKQTGVQLRIGTGFAKTFEILIPTRTASKEHVSEPVMLFNGNQRLKFNATSNFEMQTISGRGSELECIFSHRFGEEQLPDVGLRPVVPDTMPVLEPVLHWSQKPLEAWVTQDLAWWILDEFKRIYNIPAPWSIQDLMRFGLQQSGVNQLARMQNSSKEKVLENYKKFVQWLSKHPKFGLTSSTITSAKIMELYIIDEAQPKSGDLNAFNQTYSK